MSIHIHLLDPPEFYTNLDTIRGTVRLFLAKPETIGAIVVKVEGESSTTLQVPPVGSEDGWFYKHQPLVRHGPGDPGKPACALPPGQCMQETHKILYRVAQVHPPPLPGSDAPPPAALMPAGQHSFPFQIRLPFNNACANPRELARSGGFVDADAADDDDAAATAAADDSAKAKRAAGIKVMDASKQLLYHHVTQTLPPSFNGFVGQAEIRYFVKVTVQRPSLFKENWRSQTAFHFLPIEPVRPRPSAREVFVERPFTFRPRNLSADASGLRRASSALFGLGSSSAPSSPLPPPSPFTPTAANGALLGGLAPSVRITVYTPFPATLTCKESIPLRVVAEKLAPSREAVHLTSFFVRLVGNTRLRSQDLEHIKPTSFIVISESDLNILVAHPDAPVGSEIRLPSRLWSNKPLPTTVLPSFLTCNVAREYRLEVRVGLSWGQPPRAGYAGSSTGAGGSSAAALAPAGLALPPPRAGGKLTKQEKKERKAAIKALRHQPPAQVAPGLQTITMTLTLQNVQVYSGIKPSQTLVDAATRYHNQRRQHEPRRQHQQQNQDQNPRRYHEQRHGQDQERYHELPQESSYHERHRGRYQDWHHERRQDWNHGRYQDWHHGRHQDWHYGRRQDWHHERHQGRHDERYQDHQHRPQQPQQAPPLPQRQDTFELSAVPPTPVPRPLATTIAVRAGADSRLPPVSPMSPVSPMPPITPITPTTPNTPSAGPPPPVVAELPARPVVRRRPIPAAFAAQQRLEQQQQQERLDRARNEKSRPFPDHDPAGPAPLAGQRAGDGGDGSTVGRQAPSQQYHLYPQQTDPYAYSPAVRGGGGHGGGGGSSGSALPADAYALNRAMSPRVAAAIDAFAFTDTSSISTGWGAGVSPTESASPLYAFSSYEEDPPPSYDEAMAEAVSGSGRAHARVGDR